MQVRWEYLTPPEFKKLVKEEQICILPLGILERHGEHLPYGTDGLSVHAIACRAAELEPCVVFPTYWFGQGHEASCFAGSVNFPPRLLYEMLEVLLDQIARNGFKKIV
ncbi:creatininase family protein, partial [Ruthenibacterium lactatiformans]